MNKTIARRTIKAVTLRNMQGNWLKVFIFLLLSAFILELICSFLPIYIPTDEEFKSLWDSGDIQLLLQLIFPLGITDRTIGLIGIVILLNVLIFSPLKVGRCRYFLGVARGEKPRFGEFFSPIADLKTVFSSIALNIIIFVVSLLWAILFFSMPFALMLGAVMIGSTTLFTFARVLNCLIAIFMILWTSRYDFAFLIFAEGKNGGLFSSYKAFMKMMRYNSGECIVLRATYFIWNIVSFLIPPITMIYSALRGAVYAKYLMYFNGELTIEGRPASDSTAE